MNQLIKDNNHIFSKINYFLILILPISIIAGSLISNINIILICLIFIFDLFQRKDFFLLKDKNFYFLIFIYIYLILNSLFVSQNVESITRAVGFIRFIFLAYSIFFYFKIYKNDFLKYWMIIFIIVSFDILYEYIFGFNTIGFSSTYPGRIASFTGDELKIGGFYFGFFAMVLIYIFRKNKFYFYFSAIFFLIIASAIGEKSNFLKILISFLFLVYFFLDKKNIIRILSILILSTSVILIVNIVQDLRESFLGELPLIKQSRVILHTIYPKPFTVADIKENKNFKDHIVSTRYFAHYSTAFEMVKKSPIFGVGLKNFPLECQKEDYINEDFLFHSVRCSTHPHQLHLDILTSLGFVGYLLLMISILYLILKNCLIFLKQKNLFTLSGTIFLISTLLIPVPSGSFFTSYGATILWINIGILLAYEKYSYEN